MKKPLRLGAMLTLLALSMIPVAAQADLATSAEELKGIRTALDRLVLLHEKQQQHREVELLLARIEMRERRIGPLESRLQRAEVEVRDNEEHLAMLEKMREQHNTQLDVEIKDGTDVPRSETRQMLEDIERTFEAATDRIKESTLRLRRLEDDIAEQKEEIEILDEQLTELLEPKSPGRR